MVKQHIDALIISTYDSDGAGIFANQLALNIHNMGLKTKILCLRSQIGSELTYGIFDGKKLSWLFYRIVAQMLSILFQRDSSFAFIHFFTLPWFVVLQRLRQIGSCEVIICTYSSGLVSFKGLERISKYFSNAPIIFYPVDMNLFTGGCHFANQCKGFENNCEKCPAVSPAYQIFVNKAFHNKRKVINRLANKYAIAASNEWNKHMNSSRIFCEVDLYDLYMSVDARRFGKFETIRKKLRTKDKLKSRVLLVRSSVEPRKGAKTFVETINMLLKKDHKLIDETTILTVGDETIAGALSNLDMDVRSLGYLYTGDEMLKAYAKADYFVCTSVYEGGPMMVAESLMSFTPVITTDVGLARNLIKEGTNGFIVPVEDVERMVSACVGALNLNDIETQKLRYNSRQSVEAKLSSEKFNQEFKKIITDVSVKRKS